MIKFNSQAIGKAAEGEALIASLDQKIDAAVTAHPPRTDPAEKSG